MPGADPGSVERRLSGILPPVVAVAVGSLAARPPPLLPEEEMAARPMAPARRREFAAGRACARRALALLGGDGDRPVPVSPDRAPVWPLGIVGSISHGGGLAAAAVATGAELAGIGIDLELAGDLEDGLVRRIAAPQEIDRTLPRLAAGASEGARILFSAKESAFKCLWPLTGQFLEFQDLAMSPGPDRGRLAVSSRSPRAPGELVQRLVVAWDCRDGLVLTAAWIAHAPGVRQEG